MSVGDQSERERRFQLRWLGVGAVALVVIAGVVVWSLVRDSGDGEDGAAQPRAPAELATVKDLRALARGSPAPVFWAGPGLTGSYELSQTSDGRIYVRYLPPGVEAGDPRGDFLTVGTYPQADALEVVRQRGQAEGAVLRELPNGGLAVFDESAPTSVYLAYPGIPRLIEVFDPSAERARELAFSGGIVPVVGEDTETAPASRPRSRSRSLREAAREVEHPVYWLGPRSGFTYELTRLPNGQVYIRYLPEGVEVGDPRPEFDTIGTYPAQDGLAAAETAAGADAEGSSSPTGAKPSSARRRRPTSTSPSLTPTTTSSCSTPTRDGPRSSSTPAKSCRFAEGANTRQEQSARVRSPGRLV